MAEQGACALCVSVAVLADSVADEGERRNLINLIQERHPGQR